MAINHKALLALSLSAALTAGAAQALACPDTQPRSLDPTLTVHFADLNLNDPEAARVLYGRLQSAAQTVCSRPGTALWDSRRGAAFKECYRTTIDEAVRKVDRPTLTALHLHMGTANRSSSTRTNE